MPYQPTAQEHERAAHMKASLSLSPSQATEYSTLVAQALRFHENGWLRHLPVTGQVRIVRLYEYSSQLFGGRYLVAACERTWFRTVYPDTDAVCLPKLRFAQWELPPLVVVPALPGRRPTERFTSVLEHEIVHVHQALLDTFPSLHPRCNASDLLDFHFALARAEYEANLIQLTRWPAIYQSRSATSLEHWCIVRGYSQGLETVLRRSALDDVEPRHIEGFLNQMERSLPDRMSAAGLDPAFAPWLMERLPEHVKYALDLAVLGPFPEFVGRASVRAAAVWVLARLSPPETGARAKENG